MPRDQNSELAADCSKMDVQQGRSERRGEAYFGPYVEPLSDARTQLADFFYILLEDGLGQAPTGFIKISIRLCVAEANMVGSCRTGEKRLSRYTGHTGFL